MPSNSFGQVFRITTFGESHGPGIGVIIDGCPAGLLLSESDIDAELKKRQPGTSPYTSPRTEEDKVEILSGIFEGSTTGTPIALLIRNKNADSSAYEPIKHLYRPGHANYTYLEKYGIFDHRGGGRSSGRETAARVAAGAIAKKLLRRFDVHCISFISAIGGVDISIPDYYDLDALRRKIDASPIFCPDDKAGMQIMDKIEKVKEENDSVGGIVASVAHAPVGLGDPVYCKLEAMLASAMLSLPASKGFEVGHGFAAARMRGSEHNDGFAIDKTGHVQMATNRAGGILGGISTGAPILFRVAFKPTSSIRQSQETITFTKEKETFLLPDTSRHDPCVAIRAVPVVEAMTALVLVDALLMNRNAKI